MIVIIGYGNPLCGDDGFGPAVAEHLRELLGESSTGEGACKILIEQQLLPELVEELWQADEAIFIDASVEVAPGKLQIRELVMQSQEEQSQSRVLHHGFTPASLLGLCHSLYRRCPRATLYACGLSNAELGQSLSKEVEEKVPVAAKLIIESHLL